MIVTTKKLFEAAYGKYAIGAYNINNLEQTMGLFRGCMDSQAPFIIQISKGARTYTDKRMLEAIIRTANDVFPESVFAVHLDHGDAGRRRADAQRAEVVLGKAEWMGVLRGDCDGDAPLAGAGDSGGTEDHDAEASEVAEVGRRRARLLLAPPPAGLLLVDTRVRQERLAPRRGGRRRRSGGRAVALGHTPAQERRHSASRGRCHDRGHSGHPFADGEEIFPEPLGGMPQMTMTAATNCM